MKVVKTIKPKPIKINSPIEKSIFNKFEDRHIIHNGLEVPSFCTYIDSSVWDSFLAHAHASYYDKNLGHEACGVILGNYLKDEYGEYIVGHRFEKGTGSSTSKVLCEISYEDNARISQICEKESLLQVIWIHSHPGYGVFYSEQDNQTLKEKYCENFHIGIVVDNLKSQYKAFRIDEEKAIKEYLDTYLVHLSEESLSCFVPFQEEERKSLQTDREKDMGEETEHAGQDVISEQFNEKDPIVIKAKKVNKKKDRIYLKATLTVILIFQLLQLGFAIYNSRLILF